MPLSARKSHATLPRPPSSRRRSGAAWPGKRALVGSRVVIPGLDADDVAQACHAPRRRDALRAAPLVHTDSRATATLSNERSQATVGDRPAVPCNFVKEAATYNGELGSGVKSNARDAFRDDCKAMPAFGNNCASRDRVEACHGESPDCKRAYDHQTRTCCMHCVRRSAQRDPLPTGRRQDVPGWQHSQNQAKAQSSRRL